MLKKLKKAFTLVELLIVITILGILALMAVPNYLRGVENAKNREPQSILRLMAYAEKMYRLQYGGYISCAGTNNCNNKLGLEISSQDWNFYIDGVAANAFLTHAKRLNGPDSRVFTVDQDLVETCAGSALFCP